jgi:hypothetical protein
MLQSVMKLRRIHSAESGANMALPKKSATRNSRLVTLTRECSGAGQRQRWRAPHGKRAPRCARRSVYHAVTYASPTCSKRIVIQFPESCNASRTRLTIRDQKESALSQTASPIQFLRASG